LLLLGGNGLVTWAEQWLPSGVAALIITTTPLWMLLFEWLVFRGPRPRAIVWIGIALGFAGVALLIRPQMNNGGTAHVWAVLAMCAAPIMWSLGSLSSQRARRLDPPLLNTSLQMLCGGGLMFAVGLLLGESGRFDPAAISIRSWLAFAYLVTFGSLLAFTTYMWLLRVARPSVISTYAYVNPLVAVFLGAALGGEVLTAHVGLATILILGAVALIALRRRPAQPQVVSSDNIEPATVDATVARAKVCLEECKG
jgi:drug/metabolite transporter (DMT)-like permease